jgi:hypothetical protein
MKDWTGNKKIVKPVKTSFNTKSGRVSFTAKKVITKPVRVSFTVKKIK